MAAEGGEEETVRLNLLFCLISFSYFVNTSYFSMWVMEGFRREKDDQLQQFNKTLLISSAFFLIASFLQFVAANSYIGCRLKDVFMGEEKVLGRMIKPFLIGYGLLILGMFTVSRNMEWHYMVVPILLFGFHYVLVTHLTERIDRGKNTQGYLGYHKLFYYCEVPIASCRPLPTSSCQES